MANTVSIIGCGWLGLPLATTLIDNGYTVLGSTTDKTKVPDLEKAHISPFIVDLNPEQTLNADPQLFDVETLIITIPFKRTLPDPMTYYTQLAYLHDMAVKQSCQNIIMCSSTSVYANTNRSCTETSPIAETDRAIALHKTEQLFLNSPKVQACILRFAGLIGPQREPAHFFAGKKDVLGPNNPVNLIHLEDCIGIICRILEQGVQNICLNAVSDEHPTRKELYTQQAHKHGLRAPNFVEESTAPYKVVENSVLKKTLNYRFIHPSPCI